MNRHGFKVDPAIPGTEKTVLYRSGMKHIATFPAGTRFCRHGDNLLWCILSIRQ